MWDDTKNLGMQILGFYGHEGHRPGGFLEALLTARSKADMSNKYRLDEGFPELSSLMLHFDAEGPESFRRWLDTMA